MQTGRANAGDRPSERNARTPNACTLSALRPCKFRRQQGRPHGVDDTVSSGDPRMLRRRRARRPLGVREGPHTPRRPRRLRRTPRDQATTVSGDPIISGRPHGLRLSRRSRQDVDRRTCFAESAQPVVLRLFGPGIGPTQNDSKPAKMRAMTQTGTALDAMSSEGLQRNGWLESIAATVAGSCCAGASPTFTTQRRNAAMSLSNDSATHCSRRLTYTQNSKGPGGPECSGKPTSLHEPTADPNNKLRPNLATCRLTGTMSNLSRAYVAPRLVELGSKWVISTCNWPISVQIRAVPSWVCLGGLL